MRTTWVVAIYMLFLFGTGISMTLEMQYAGTGLVDTFFPAMRPGFVEGGSIPILGFFVAVWEWITALWDIFWWDYSFFKGAWGILKYLGWAISIGIVWSIVLAIRGVSSS